MAYPVINRDGCFMRPFPVDAFNCAPSTTDGEVTEIYFTSTALLPEDLADATAFNARIDNTPDSTFDLVRIKVTGKVSVTEPGVQRVEGGQEVRTGKFKFALEAEQYNDTTVNYEFVRAVQYGNAPMIMYYRIGNFLYGGPSEVYDGIAANVIAYQTAEGAGTLSKNIYKATWEDALQPKRMAHPLA
jgi:hypothetical protein